MANSAFEQKQTGNASTTASGSVEIATPAQVVAKTAVGETGAPLAVSPADLPDVPAAYEVDIQEFSVNGTWTKPANASMVLLQMWAAGASGSRRSDGSGYGGGGGAYLEKWIPASELGATEAVVVGVGGAAVSADNTVGNVGGNSELAGIVVYGGAGGAAGGISGPGGGGGGQKSAGSGGVGGAPFGGAAGSSSVGGTSIFGGAGGGGGSGQSGGEAVYGGGGGSHRTGNGGASTWGGGGGGGGAGGASRFGGAGGAQHAAGSVPGGGGGSGQASPSGAGADGFVRLTTY